MRFPDISSFHSIIKNQEVVQVKLRPDLVHFKLKITFIDDSILHVRENHLPVSNWHEYSYQWQDDVNQLIHRWDNSHERHLLSVPPHHQHVGSEENIQTSEPMTLEKVLAYIASQLSPQ
ncbi:DUF6516 family protein [Larkinella sp. C7]|jgi:hypothetical protein|uniref:toxin-antitoxin system TumE family protein n=1 Tax=Larkinella sp. C7 TaxID=2576607 RepID=UPI00111127AA|nr:DUF6516 family protein [Larkinella sp. C7]